MDEEHLPRAQKIALRLLGIRARSEKEIRRRLQKKKFSKNVVDETVAYLKRLRYLDDRRFTKDWIAARLEKPFGIGRISVELNVKGISQEIIREELTKVEQDYSEEKIVAQLVKQRAAKYKNIEPYKIKRRVFEYLARRGFRLESIQNAVQKL